MIPDGQQQDTDDTGDLSCRGQIWVYGYVILTVMAAGRHDEGKWSLSRTTSQWNNCVKHETRS